MTGIEANFAKRNFSVSLKGKVAIITGSRVKIGFQSCLKLLRAGCEVVATTRFPNSAVASYRAERDFDVWKDNLHVYGLDLRDVTGIEAFTRFLKMRYGERGVDILVNNACQTIRRPGGYYSPMMGKEQEIWKDSDDVHRGLLKGCLEFERVRRRLVLEHSAQGGDKNGGVGLLDSCSDPIPLLEDKVNDSTCADGAEKNHRVTSEALTVSNAQLASERSPTVTPFETTGLSHSAAMSQMIVLPEDVGVPDSVLPRGATDVNGQQLDLRRTNSWLLKMDEVSTPEVRKEHYL